MSESELGDEGTGVDNDDDDDSLDLADDSGETNRPRAKTKRRRKRQVSQKFRNEDLPAGTARRFRSMFLPMWYEHVARFEEPWDLGDRISDAQRLWDRVFPQHLHRVEKKNEPVFFLVRCFLFGARIAHIPVGQATNLRLARPLRIAW
jgi:hypothetical protein